MSATPLRSLLHRADPVRFARETLGFAPDANQASVLTVAAQRVILACHRQFGKSTTAAVKAIHHALHNPESLTIIVAPTLRQGGLLLDTIHRFARKLSLELKPDRYNRPSLVLPNGAKVVAVPSEEQNIRGFSAVSLLLIDEAARVPDEVWSAVLPMVSTVNGAVWLMSTPAGKQGFFADMWFQGGPSWHRIRATVEQSTRITREVADEQRRCLSRAQYASDYLCEFGDIEDQVFRTASVERAFQPGVEPLVVTPGWSPVWHHGRSTDFGWFVGVDLAQTRDYTAFAVLELHSWENGWVGASGFDHLTDTTLRLRHLERIRDTSYPEILSRLTSLVEFLGSRTTLVVDATGLGAPFIDFLRQSSLRLRMDTPSRPLREIQAQADQFTCQGYLLPVTITGGGVAAASVRGGYNVPKIDLIESVDRVLDAGRLQIAADLSEASTLRGELLGLRRHGNRFEPHSSLGHDDLVMALALAAWRVGRYRKDILLPPRDILRRPA